MVVLKPIEAELKTHTAPNPVSIGFHSVGSQESTGNFYQIMINDMKRFLIADPGLVNKYVLFESMYKLDPEVRDAITMVSFTVMNSYEGVELSEKYAPSEADFLLNVQKILAELRMSNKLSDWIRLLITNGDVIYRIWREDKSDKNRITRLELLPAYAVTIMSQRYEKSPESEKVIKFKDSYLISERQQNATTGTGGNITTNPSTAASTGGSSGEEGTKFIGKGQAEAEIKAEDILHLSFQPEGNSCLDVMGRETFGIWGCSPLESLIFTLKLKVAITLDYLRWSKNGLPRWDYTLALGEALNLQNYPGNYAQKIKLAREAAREIFREFEAQLYYTDSDPNSPTYNKKLPIEVDHAFVHGENVTGEMKGGIPAQAGYLEVVEKCDKSICAALGVPLSLFGYESGSTYAIGYITASFMASFGGGLLKSVESSLEDFLRREFERRGLKYIDLDFDNLNIKFKIDNSDEINIKLAIEAQKVNLAVLGLRGQLYTLNEARAKADLPPREDGDVFITPSAMPGTTGGEGDLFSSLTAQGQGKLPQYGMHGLGMPDREPDLENNIIVAYQKAVTGYMQELERAFDEHTTFFDEEEHNHEGHNHKEPNN